MKSEIYKKGCTTNKISGEHFKKLIPGPNVEPIKSVFLWNGAWHL